MRRKSASNRLTVGESFKYIIFNKPFGVVTTFTDNLGRPTIADYVSIPQVYAAGRLDRDSEGLLFLTSDGSLVHRLTDPRYKMPKSYLVQVEGVPDRESLDRLRYGVMVQGKKTKTAQVELLEQPTDLWPRSVPVRFRRSVPTAWLQIVLSEGMNRQIRRMTAIVGFPTLRLIRTAIGSMTLEGLQPGEWRRLEPDEWRALKNFQLG